MLDAIDMVGNEVVDGTGEICIEKLILSSNGRKWLRA